MCIRDSALIAPAGFGKTTLARQWTSNHNSAGAWYSVGSEGFDVAAVAARIAAVVSTVVRESPLRLLITSRKRPSWASSRLRLYGELLEISRAELEMTPSEAREVLAPIVSDEQRTQLAKLCHGWPAVLGLAARLGGASLPRNALLPGLYEYFAEELYSSASSAVSYTHLTLPTILRV